MKEDLKKTALFDTEKNLGAHFIEFAGYEMPFYFESVLKEHQAVRNQAGIFNVSHMGKLKISGAKSKEFLSRLTANDPERLKTGEIQYSMILNETGGVKDDILIYRFEKYFLLIVNAINTEKIFKWLKDNNNENVLIENLSDELFILALQGPASEKIIFSLFGKDIVSLFYYHFLELELDGEKLIVSRTGYTGEDGFEIIGSHNFARRLWLRLGSLGSDFGLIPCGLGARDILRIEAGLPLYGNELEEDITPLEAGLERIVKFYKKDFIGKKRLEELKQTKLNRILAGLIIEENVIPRKEILIYNQNGQEEIGKITSGTFSPSLQMPVAMAFLNPKEIEVGNEVKILTRDKLWSARVVELPFYRHRTKKFKDVK